MGGPSTVGSQDDQVCSPRGSCNPCHSGVFGESARVSRRHLIPAFGWRTGMRRQGGPRRSNTPGSRPKRIARLARSAIPQSRSLSRDQLRPAAVQYGRPAPIRIWPLFTEAARPTTMLYVLSMPRRQRSRETKRQYFPPCGTMVAPSIAFDGWLRSRIRRGRQILPSFATTVGAFPRPELSGWPRLTSADVGCLWGIRTEVVGATGILAGHRLAAHGL